MTIGAAADDAAQLAQSIAFCRRLTQQQAKNFYYALRLLGEPKRSAMYVLYAWMRLADDIADAEDGRTVEQKAEQLDTFGLQTHAALEGLAPADDGREIWPAFVEMVRRYSIPAELFDEMIAGQRQDLRPMQIQTFAELHQYCYRVAGVVGLASIHIWGYEGGESTHRLAIDRGVAFQLTNILRDLREDASRGRVYLPEKGISTFSPDAAFVSLMRFQIDRAESYYRASADLESRIHPDSRPALIAMTSIYRGLLSKIARDPTRVLRGRVRLSTFSKLLIAWRAWRSR